MVEQPQNMSCPWLDIQQSRARRVCRVGLLQGVNQLQEQGLTACRVGLMQTRSWPHEQRPATAQGQRYLKHLGHGAMSCMTALPLSDPA